MVDGVARVVVLGASGVFGTRLIRLLAAQPGLRVVAAARGLPALQRIATTACTDGSRVECWPIDIGSADFATELARQQPTIVVDCCGPFQTRDDGLPQLAIAQRFHLIDLADAADYVAQIGRFDAAARTAGILICSGASSVPGLSSAVIAALRPRFARLDHVDIGIVPGNQTERGLATIESILSMVGKRIAAFRDGTQTTTIGWSGLQRRIYPQPIGPRWLARCAVPDSLVVPAAFPGLRSLEFRAGLQLKRMHLGLWLAHFLVRAGLLDTLTPYARGLKRISERWMRAGSDAGGMHVAMRGVDADGKAMELTWTLIAEHGDGPFVPAACAATLVRLLVAEKLALRGAIPCVATLPLQEILKTLAPHAIRTELVQTT